MKLRGRNGKIYESLCSETQPEDHTTSIPSPSSTIKLTILKMKENPREEMKVNQRQIKGLGDNFLTGKIKRKKTLKESYTIINETTLHMAVSYTHLDVYKRQVECYC